MTRTQLLRSHAVAVRQSRPLAVTARGDDVSGWLALFTVVFLSGLVLGLAFVR